MKTLLSLFFFAFSASVTLAQESLPLGSPLPNFSESWAKMKGLDGKEHTLQSVKGEKGTLVVFTCVHCPFVKAWDDRLTALSNEFQKKGIGVIWINSNDFEKQPEDRPEEMQKQVNEHGLDKSIPYVIDSTSQVARAFGATRTPEVFLFAASGDLAYKGAIDRSHKNPPEKNSSDDYLRLALNGLVEGKSFERKETPSIGCTIKFRDQKS